MNILRCDYEYMSFLGLKKAPTYG